MGNGEVRGHTRVVDLSRARVDRLEQLVDLLVRHLLAQLREHVPQLTGADEPVALLVEHLEATDELLCRASSAQES